MKWCFDTSALVEPWVRHYPREMFEPVWDKLAELAADGTIRAPVDVRMELEEQKDDLYKWAKGLNGFFVPSDEALLAKVKEIVNAHEGLIKPHSVKSAADPFVIALAELKGVPVVTYETLARVKAAAPKIPNVCAARGIKVVTLVDVLRVEGFKL
ncbi:MAG TPA: DUF4411 family protein [Burkholderiales bacterium]|nr:DUF4411 family protein [Burkholderiales bacterium]